MTAPQPAVEIKASLAIVVAACTAIFGKVSGLLVIWLATLALDYITGTIKAASSGTWSSAIARKGLWHKLGSIFAVLVAALADIAFSVIIGGLDSTALATRGAITGIVLTWYIFTELGSIAENAAEMGAPVPKFLINMITKVKTATEKRGENIADDDTE